MTLVFCQGKITLTPLTSINLIRQHCTQDYLNHSLNCTRLLKTIFNQMCLTEMHKSTWKPKNLMGCCSEASIYTLRCVDSLNGPQRRWSGGLQLDFMLTAPLVESLCKVRRVSGAGNSAKNEWTSALACILTL